MSSHQLYRQHQTHTLYDITLAICFTSLALYKTSHPHFMTSNHRGYVITPTILDIMSTLSVLSHPLYWWYHTNRISEITSAIIHDIIYIVCDMTATIWHHLQGLCHLIPYTCDIKTLHLWIHVNYIKHQTHGVKTIQPLYLISQPPYVYLCDHTHCINYITHTVFMTWNLLYLWHIRTV